jgi:hypothetical protein
MPIEQRILINAAPERVFRLYADVSSWSQWDPSIQYASIEGELKRGTKGRVKPTSGPAAKMVITEVTVNKSFTAVTRLPLCSMRFVHELVLSGQGTEAVHKVLFSGLLSPLFEPLIGAVIRRELPLAMQGLKQAAES